MYVYIYIYSIVIIYIYILIYYIYIYDSPLVMTNGLLLEMAIASSLIYLLETVIFHSYGSPESPWLSHLRGSTVWSWCTLPPGDTSGDLL